jgi:acyl carrier protein
MTRARFLSINQNSHKRQFPEQSQLQGLLLIRKKSARALVNKGWHSGDQMIKESEFLETIVDIFRIELDNSKLNLGISDVQSDIVEWDSLAHVRIILATERAFNIQFDVDEIEKIDSIRGMYDAIAKHKG